MATDQDVFTRLSRILETTDYQSKGDKELEEIIMQVASPIQGSKRDDDRSPRKDSSNVGGGNISSNVGGSKSSKTGGGAGGGGGGGANVTLPDRPTNYEVWQARQKMAEPLTRPTAQVKLNTQELDRMISKMHRVNRSKQDEIVRVQNEGLREELGGYKFKPEINEKSNEIAKKNGFKNLHERLKVTSSYAGPSVPRKDKSDFLIPEIVAEKFKWRERKLAEQERALEEKCSFQPERQGKKVSEMYLKKMGRKPENRPVEQLAADFFNYQKEKERRNEMRKQIVEEIEGRHLVFAPTLPQTTLKVHKSLAMNNSLEYDPVTRTTKVIRKTATEDADDLIVGPTLLLESEHPYRNNLNEHTVISVPGAVSYSITFREGTSTEPVHDYVRFLKFENYEIVHGCGKYCGGLEKEEEVFDPQTGNTLFLRKASSSNWPGLGGRPPLVINANKFVVHFKTNREVTDYGFQMEIIPTVNPRLSESSKDKSNTFQPEISFRGSQKAGSSNSSQSVHERLYAVAVQVQQNKHNQIAEMIKSKLNVSLAPWEDEREQLNKNTSWTGQQNHKPKSQFGQILNQLIIPFGEQSSVALVEFDDTVLQVWKSLRTAADPKERIPVHL